MRFIADRMLGKLGKWLRILGYDTIYFNGDDIEKLKKLAIDEGRIILTRNKKIIFNELKGKIVWIEEDNPYLQLKELILKGLISSSEKNLFSRCLICNKELESISKSEIKGMVPDYIYMYHKEFFICPQCKRVYWPGTHLKNMKIKLEELFKT